jgi:hypothetical protein
LLEEYQNGLIRHGHSSWLDTVRNGQDKALPLLRFQKGDLIATFSENVMHSRPGPYREGSTALTPYAFTEFRTYVCDERIL